MFAQCTRGGSTTRMRKERLPGWRAVMWLDRLHTAAAFTVLAILVVLTLTVGVVVFLVDLIV